MPLRPSHIVPPLVALAMLLAGCRGDGEPSPAEKAERAMQDAIGPRASVSELALDATPRELRILALQVYALELPRGRVSRNSELWRRIDEQSVDPATYDVLWANGVRVGGAPLSELDHIREVLGIETALRTDILGRSPGRQSRDFPVEGEIGEKTIFWFDAAKRSQGRTFQRCETRMNIAFEPAPGRVQTVRISMTPIVRALNPRIVVTPQGNDYAVREVKDTTLFDLRLQADVPVGEFLIVAPSDETRWETCLGRQFFTAERDGELYERVYVLIPQVAAVRAAPTH